METIDNVIINDNTAEITNNEDMVVKLTEENEKLTSQLEVEHNNYLRALADAENIKKNFAKKQAEMYTYQYEPIIMEFLDVLDDLDRANEELSEGGKLIFNKIKVILGKFGVVKMGFNKGAEFDADKMEAISTLPMGEEMVNKVIDCPVEGYKYNGKIIRYPKVVVGA